jgi:hypothetical protein
VLAEGQQGIPDQDRKGSRKRNPDGDFVSFVKVTMASDTVLDRPAQAY